MYRAGSRQSNLDLCPPVHRPASHTKAYHAARHTRSERGDAAHASVGGRATWSQAGPWIEAAVGSVALVTRRPRRHVVASSRTTRATKSPTTKARRYPRPQAARAPAQAGLRTTVSYGMGAMRTPWASHAPPLSWDEGRAELARRRDARGWRADEEWDADLGGGHGSSVSDPDVVGVSGSSSNRPVGVARSSCASLDRSVPNTSSGGGCGVSMPPGPRREGPWVAVRG